MNAQNGFAYVHDSVVIQVEPHNPAILPIGATHTTCARIAFANGNPRVSSDSFCAGVGDVRNEVIGLRGNPIVDNEAAEARDGDREQNAQDGDRRDELNERESLI